MPRITQAVIIAGGKGTRLSAVEPLRPKILVPLDGRPLVDYQLALLARHGVDQVWFLLGHLGEHVETYVGHGARYGLRCHFVHEPAPLGTVGNLPAIRDHLHSDFFILYGDLMVELDLARLTAFHFERTAAATLVVHPSSHPHDSDLVDLDSTQRIQRLLPARTRTAGWYRNLVNAALYVSSRDALEFIEEDVAQDWIAHVFTRMVAAGRALYGYQTSEYLKDMGTPDRLAAVHRDIVSGRVQAASGRRAAVFLDRDGVLNREVDELTDIDELELLPGAAQAVRRLNQAGILVVVITNQPMIAKGTLSERALAAIHAKLETLLGRHGAFVDAIYHCPHHPERGWPGERLDLKVPCSCRKPAPGMLLRAADELPIALDRSCMIGDSWRDIAAARAAGIPAYGVRTGAGFRDHTPEHAPDLIFDDLGRAVDFAIGAVAPPLPP